MLEKGPHALGRIDIHGGMPNNELWQGLAARPGMPAARNGVENQLVASSTAGILDSADLPFGGDDLARFGAAVLAGQFRDPFRHGRERQVERAGWPAQIWDDWVSRAMKNNRRHQAGRRTVAPRQQVGTRDAPDGSNPLGELAG